MNGFARSVAVVLATLVSFVTVYEAVADEPVCLKLSVTSGLCILWSSQEGNDPFSPGEGEAPTSGPARCMNNGTEVPCTHAEFGWWHGGRRCYARVAHQVPHYVADPWEGRTHGVIMECTHPGASEPSVWFWAAAPDAREAVPDARMLAQQAVEYMDLEAIRIGSMPKLTGDVPQSTGIVGFNVWLWVDGVRASTFGPITKSAMAGGYTVTATAQVREIVWDMGNGDVVSCGSGTPFTGQYLGPEQQSPDCGYTYTKDGDYEISATSYWEVTWSGIGQSGTMSLELVAEGNLTIAEIQVLNVASGQG